MKKINCIGQHEAIETQSHLNADPDDSSNDRVSASDDADKRQAIAQPSGTADELPNEIGGRKEGLEPTRYGDWEKNGRCIDF